MLGKDSYVVKSPECNETDDRHNNRDLSQGRFSGNELQGEVLRAIPQKGFELKTKTKNLAIQHIILVHLEHRANDVEYNALP